MTFPKLKSLLGHSPLTTAFVGVDTDGNVAIINEDGSTFALGAGVIGRLANQLRDEHGSDGEIRFLKGFSVDGDGGEGYFRWSDTPSTDDGGTILNELGVGTSSAGWRRIIEGDEYSVEWFGAVGNGTTDDTVAIQRAVNKMLGSSSLGILNFKPGKTYKISSPIFILKRNGNEYSFCSCTLRGKNQLSSVGGAHIMATQTTTPAFIVQNGYGVKFQNLYIDGQNTWPQASGKTPVNFGTYGDFNDSYFIANSCRDDRYSPHCAIAVDPFSVSTPVGNQYPGLGAYYTNTGLGGSSACVFDHVEINYFVVGVGISLSGFTQNAEAFTFQDCNIAYCKSCVAICQEQSRSTNFSNCFIGAGKIAYDCVSYGNRNGASPIIRGGATGGGYIFALAGGGSSLSWVGGHVESCYSIGYIAGGLQNSNSIKDVQFSFCRTASGYRDAVRAWIAGPMSFENCTFTQQGTAESADADVETRPVIIYTDRSFPLVFDNTNTELVGVGSPDAAQRLVFVPLSPYNVRMRACHEDTNAQNEAFFDPVLTVDNNVNHNGVMGSPGAEIRTMAPSDVGSFRKFDDRIRWYEKGLTSITVNADGTGSFTGANLEQDFVVGDLLYGGEPYVPYAPGVLSSVFTNAAGYFGKVTSVVAGGSGSVSFNAAEYVTAGTYNQYILAPWRPRHFQQVTADCNFAGTPKNLTNVTPTNRLKVGMRVLDKAGRIPANTFISAVNAGAGTATLSKDPTGGAGVENLKIYADPVYEIPRMATYGEDQAPGTTGDVLVRTSDGSARWVSQDSSRPTYSVANVSTDRTYDANATTVDEVADVLGTLIADLRARGLVQ